MMGTYSVFTSKSLLAFISLTIKWNNAFILRVRGLTVREALWNPLLKVTEQAQSTNIKKGLSYL